MLPCTRASSSAAPEVSSSGSSPGSRDTRCPSTRLAVRNGDVLPLLTPLTLVLAWSRPARGGATLACCEGGTRRRKPTLWAYNVRMNESHVAFLASDRWAEMLRTE